MNVRHGCAMLVSVCLVIAALGDAFAQEIAVRQSVICREIVDRAPVDEGEGFPKGTEHVYCYTWIEGAREETEITHNWYHEGNLKASVVLPVRGPSWRTWSSKALRPDWTGEWMVEALSRDGTPLTRLAFSIR